mmetsp:Transcript_44110/g.139185  ORF Transcript_44110/g.139185 Transcript_44110/m.139185 type:complete len:139 (+) Transcript_44110:422-838(+)
MRKICIDDNYKEDLHSKTRSSVTENYLTFSIFTKCAYDDVCAQQSQLCSKYDRESSPDSILLLQQARPEKSASSQVSNDGRTLDGISIILNQIYQWNWFARAFGDDNLGRRGIFLRVGNLTPKKSMWLDLVAESSTCF